MGTVYGSMTDFAKREEELRRMNAELEAKRQSTLQNADNAVRHHHDKLARLRIHAPTDPDDEPISTIPVSKDNTHPRTDWLAHASPSSPLRAPEWSLTASPGPV